MHRKTADIFCRVIDNFGDAGVCWRLARQLACEHGLKVRLYIDRPEVLAQILPALAGPGASTEHAQVAALIEGVQILSWEQERTDQSAPDHPAVWGPPADLVIAAFACELPPAYRRSMRGMKRFMAGDAAPARNGASSPWINLEYLSAEAWVASHHALPSLKPDGLVEQFYFPGFTPDTGGLLREAGLLARRDAFMADARARQSLLAELGLHELASAEPDGPLRAQSLLIFVFCYRTAPLGHLMRAAALALAPQATGNLKAENLSTAFSTGLSHPLSPPPCTASAHGLSTGSSPDTSRLSPDLSDPPSALSSDFSTACGHLPTPCPQDGPAMAQQAFRSIHFLLPEDMAIDELPATPLPGVSLHRIARLPQARFDEVLWLCDANFVRGEDSLVRAIWAGKPLLWHIYPQQDQAHVPKLKAFLDLRPASERALALAWNGLTAHGDMAHALAQWLQDFGALRLASRQWSARLASQPDLATRLLRAAAIAPDESPDA